MSDKNFIAQQFFKFLPYFGTFGTFVFGGLYLKNWKKTRSENKKTNFTNEADISEDFLERLERISRKAGNFHEQKEEIRSDILRVIRLSEVHFETCKNPKDELKKMLDSLSKKYKNYE